MAVVTRNALRHGRRAAVLTALGINLGVLFWVLSAALGLIQVQTTLEAVGTGLVIVIAGGLFYLMIRAMARIQMPPRPGRVD